MSDEVDIGELKACTTGFAFGEGDLPAVICGNLTDDSESEAGAMVCIGFSRFEHAIAIRCWNPWSVILDEETILEVADGDGDPLITVFDGISKQVLEDLLQSWGVG